MANIDAYLGVLKTETEALEKRDLNAFAELQERKMGCAHSAHAGISEIIAYPGGLSRLPSETRRKIEARRHEIITLSERNLKALGRVQRGMRRLGEQIVSEARRAAGEDTSFKYGSAGSMDKPKRRVSLGVSESA